MALLTDPKLQADVTAVAALPSAASPTTRLGSTAIALIAVAMVTAPIGYMAMFSVFRAYDDEGSFLITLRDYLAGQPLLSPDNSYYGPVYYEVMGALFKVLGIVPTNDSGRFVTLIAWLIASVLGAIVAYRLTRNLWLTLAAQLVTFSLLSALSQEPMATYGLTTLLLLGLALAATFNGTRPRGAAVAIGALVAALCLVKINVGAFALLAVVFAWTCGLPSRWRRLAAPAMAGVLTLAPFGLMADLLGRGWVLELALLASGSAAAAGIAAIAAPRLMQSPRAAWLAPGGGVIAAVSLGVAFAGGTHPADLWNGLVVSAFRFPQLFTFPVNINPLADIWALLALIACVACHRFRATGGVPDMARVAAGLFVLVSVLLLPSSVFLLGLPLSWLVTLGPRNQPVSYARLLLPALAVMESLQAYPVAGTQLSMAALLMVPIGVIVLHDGVSGLRARAATRVAPSALLFAAIALALQGFLAGSQFAAASPLGLPGAESVRMPAQQAAQIRRLVAAIDRDCSSFITFPGMNSLYVWTGQVPPTGLRYGVWWLTPDVADQQAAVAQLGTRSRVCVVKDQSIIDFWAEGRPVPRQPMVDFIDQSFVDGGSYGEYQILVQR